MSVYILPKVRCLKITEWGLAITVSLFSQEVWRCSEFFGYVLSFSVIWTDVWCTLGERNGMNVSKSSIMFSWGPYLIFSNIQALSLFCHHILLLAARCIHNQNSIWIFCFPATIVEFAQKKRLLHWLPIRQHIIFKTLVLVYKYLTTGQPKYFAPYLSLYKSAMNTRRSNPKNLFLQVPHYCASIHKSKVQFNNSFSYDAPKLWNNLPHDISSAPNLSCFKSRLKTYLFQKSFSP